LGALIHYVPPKSALDQPLNHGTIVAGCNIGFPFLGAVGNIIAFDVQIDVDIVTEHILPDKLKVAFDALIVDNILLLPQLSFRSF
jgi:hypothetical protein